MFLTLLISMAMAKENWLCTTESSQLQGTTILACGVGEGANEAMARAEALNNAKLEFASLCNDSAECKSHTYLIEPKRTTCDNDNGTWKCYRELAYTQDQLVVNGKKYPPMMTSPYVRYMWDMHLATMAATARMINPSNH